MTVHSHVRAAAGALAGAAALTLASASGATTPFDGKTLKLDKCPQSGPSEGLQ